MTDQHHQAFAKAINEFLTSHATISLDDVPEDFLLRSLLLGLKSQSTSLRSKSIDYLMQMKKIGKYEPPPDPPEDADDDYEDEYEEPDPKEEEARRILDELGGA